MSATVVAAPTASAGGAAAAAAKRAHAARVKAARAGEKVAMADGFMSSASTKERDLAAELRVESEFVDNVDGSGGDPLDPERLTEAAIERAARSLPPLRADVDTSTMHPANLVGKYHAWRIANSFPIPGHALVDDFRRRYLAVYATEQEKSLREERAERERLAEVKLAVADRKDASRLPSEVEVLVARAEAVIEAQAKAASVRAAAERAARFEASPEELLVFRLMRERKVVEVEQLFARGEVNVGTVETGTASTGLVRATSMGLLTVVRLYCRAGADVNYVMPTGLTPLHCAWDAWLKLGETHPAKRMRYLIARDIVQLLVEFGADANFASAGGITPLHMAAMFGHDDIVALLLRNKADRALRDHQGRTPRDLALKAGHRGAAGLLANWGHVQEAYRREEFRREWETALAGVVHRDRDRLHGAGAKGAQVRGGGGGGGGGPPPPPPPAPPPRL
jgi:hypothetical protein